MIDPAHYRGREQTYVKHIFLDRYLERVAYVTLGGQRHWSEFVYVDAFSGPWRAHDEKKSDTSVAISLAKLGAVREGLQKKGRSTAFKAMFVERDLAAFAELNSLLEGFPAIQTRAINGEFHDHVAEAMAFIGNAFSLTFVDPTGWTIDLVRLQPILRLRGEVIVNFMYDPISRFLTSDGDTAVADSFDPIFGGPSWRSEIETSLAGGASREDAIVEVFGRRFRRAGNFQFVTSTRILWPLADRTYYHLFYGTRHWRGLQAFRAAERDALEAQEQVRVGAKREIRERRTGMKDLFPAGAAPQIESDVAERRRKMRAMARHRLGNLLDRKSRFRAQEAFSVMLEVPLIPIELAQRILLEAEKEGDLAIDWGKRQRAPQPDTLVTSRRRG